MERGGGEVDRRCREDNSNHCTGSVETLHMYMYTVLGTWLVPFHSKYLTGELVHSVPHVALHDHHGVEGSCSNGVVTVTDLGGD